MHLLQETDIECEKLDQIEVVFSLEVNDEGAFFSCDAHSSFILISS